MSCRDLAALRGAAAAGFGAVLAMLVFVLLAFRGAGVADLRAQAAHGGNLAGAAGHVGDGKVADLGAIHIGGDAVGHHFDVVLLKAGGRAMIAGDGAGLAGFDAGLVLLVAHGFSELGLESEGESGKPDRIRKCSEICE